PHKARSTRNWRRSAGPATPRRSRNWRRDWSRSPRRCSTRPGRASRHCPSPARSSGCCPRPSTRSAGSARVPETERGAVVREYLFGVGGAGRGGRAATLPAVSPATGEEFASVAVASTADVDDAVAAAGAAAPAWAALSAFERAACCRAVAAAIDVHADDLARALTEDQGKPLAAEARDEVSELSEYFRMAAEDPTRMPGAAPPSLSPTRPALT